MKPRDIVGVAARLLVLGLVITGAAGTAAAAGIGDLAPAWDGKGPIAMALPVKAAVDLPPLDAGAVDIQAARAEDREREAQGLPPRFALAREVSITPADQGTWEDLDSRWRLWRLRIQAPGALSVNLGFGAYRLPKGGRLDLYPTDMAAQDDPRLHWVFSEQDNQAHGQLWTPVVLADDVVLELLIPATADYDLLLTSINKGYADFGQDLADKAGSCNIDVICPEGDPWRTEIASVGVYTLNGVWTCTGAMINNTAQNQTPYFLTANHCGITSGNAASMVIYWNFESPTCGQLGGGSLADQSAGATFRAASSASDFCLVELNSSPDPGFGVTFAGWDRSSADPTSAVAIHHPSTDEKSISFEYDPTSTTSYLGTAVPGDGTHLRITDWDLGTTEPGSSGSPLFSPGHRIVGQLHGGYAACGNDDSDWYGRLSVSWSGLSGYLDPLGTGALTLDTLNPYAAAFQVTPADGLTAAGPQGGPFTPDSRVYTLQNGNAFAIDYQASADAAWIDVDPASGSIPAGGSVQVTVSLAAAADFLGTGLYAGTVDFVNLTDGVGDTQRPVQLQVGVPQLVYAVTMDADPGWTMGTGWAYGTPLGGGGEYGNPDPVAGYTGTKVVGYNLAGDYDNNLPERYLVSSPFDCANLSGVTVKFRRWLGVEQSAYDHAAFQVSADGVNFTTLWSNGAEVADGSWTQVAYDIGAVADQQPAVYLRWVMGTTDGSWRYCGWNIDDVEIWGLQSSLSAAPPAPGPQLALSSHPNPFNPLTRIAFELTRDGPAQLRIYDLQGRIVRRLVTEDLPAGPHAVIWDGTDDGGRPVGSGVYLARLAAGGAAVQHKLVLIK